MKSFWRNLINNISHTVESEAIRSNLETNLMMIIKFKFKFYSFDAAKIALEIEFNHSQIIMKYV